MQKNKLVIIAGPTAVGKTENSIRLAKAINGEIISADSMQVYKRMDIGSAKIMPEEMQGIRHHLIDVLEPTEEFNIVRFQTMAKKAVQEIVSNGKIPMLVGGTGFYIQSLLYDIDFKEEENIDTTLRESLQHFADTNGKEVLHERLKEIDPESAEAIPPGNVKRVIRAIEFYETHHEKISSHNKEQKEKESPYNFAFFVLTDERPVLYERIDKRVDSMLKNGLIDEVKALQAEGLTRSHISMQGLGYKEILAYLEGEITLEEAIYILKRDTRHFAKRQITWFKREKEVNWLDKSKFVHNDDAVFEEMMKHLRNKDII
ncbi:MAG: tRNA (adenosine(37)-N6)-dimethylallyltransferase MiaA [Lachnospiraceae bacterium]|nr:tRNA (adenosine(37)-N6)-dimethylallyltransferase MiaA [Lachnospiraceae bacterium]